MILHRHLEIIASRFLESATARSAWTSLRCPGDARRCTCELLQDGTDLAAALDHEKEDRRPWDANREQANSRRGPRNQPWAAAILHREACYAWLRGKCVLLPDATFLSTSTLAPHSTRQIQRILGLERARAPRPTTPCSFCRCK